MKILLWISGGVVFVFALVLWFMWFAGLIALPLQRTLGDTPKQGDIRIACVGDSITFGCLVLNRSKNNYPGVLQRMLGTGYNVQNFGVSGRTAMEDGDFPYIKELNYKKSREYLPDVVFIKFGSNDSKPQNWKGKAAFKAHYTKLIQNYLNLESKPAVYILTPAMPYYIKGQTEGSMKYDIRKPEVMEAAASAEEIAAELKVKVIDINTITDGHPDWFRFDGIHPDAKGAAAIAKTVYDEYTKSKVSK